MRNEVSQHVENKRNPIDQAGRIGGHADNVWKIQAALEDAGIIFVDENDIGGVGIRLKKGPPRG